MLRELLQQDRFEETLKEGEKKFKQLLKQAAECDAQEEELFQELEVPPEQVSAFLSNPVNFTEQDWAEIQRQMAEYDEKVGQALNRKRDRAKLRRSYSERSQVRQHWLYVR